MSRPRANTKYDKISSQDIEKAIIDILEDYVGEVRVQTNIASVKVAERAVQIVRSKAPRRKGRRGGAYARSWSVDKSTSASGYVTATVYSKAPHYRLTHLLENGHAKVNGGFVKGIEHIRPAEQQAIREFEAAVKEAIRNG